MYSPIHPAPKERRANTPNPPSFAFTKKQRLLNKHDFTPVFDDAPIRASNQHLLILSRLNDDKHNQARLGLVIAKKHVRRAHERNRIKRFARETFRLQQHKLPPIDAIVLARKGADTLTNQQLQQAFNGLWKRIIKRAAQLAP
ncbi:MAG TPA: ribonuclease P protein component [Marinagarivorans sp.]